MEICIGKIEYHLRAKLAHGEMMGDICNMKVTDVSNLQKHKLTEIMVARRFLEVTLGRRVAYNQKKVREAMPLKFVQKM